MNDPNIYFAMLAGIALIISLPVCVYAFFKSFTAKNFSDQVKYSLLFIVPITITFGLSILAGITEFPTYSEDIKEIPNASQLFSKLNFWQVFFISCMAITWIVGLNILLESHRKRTGKPWWTVISPFHPMLRDFNKREWKIFGGLVVVSMSFAVAALGA